MVDARLDAKLIELAKELKFRPLVPGHPFADAFALRGVDEGGKPGLYAAVLLPTNFDMTDLDMLTRFRAALTARLKQLHATLPAWPIIVQGLAELMNGQPVVPGGREYFDQLRSELTERLERSLTAAPHTASTEPVAALSAQSVTPAPAKVAAKVPVKVAAKVPVKVAAKVPVKVAAKVPVKVAAKVPMKKAAKVSVKAAAKAVAKKPAKTVKVKKAAPVKVSTGKKQVRAKASALVGKAKRGR